MRYYIRSIKAIDFHAGNKARNDCEIIYKELKLKEIKLKNINFNKKICFVKFRKFLSILLNITLYIKIYKELKEKDIIFYQFPFDNICEKLTIKIAKIKKVKTIPIVHDLDGIREKSLKKFRKEKKDLEKSSQIISHNKEMTKILKTNYKFYGKIKELFIFDYLINEKNNKEKKIDVPLRRVCYAGNLDYNKSSFIYKLNELKDINFNVYGINYQEEKNKNSFQYCGAFHPDIIHTKLQGDFGLIWDGNSLKNCEGMCGEYLKYNNPHKFSLYIAAGLPVITWDKAAISSYIIENKLGVVISSLNELKGILDNVSKEDYEVMKSNVIKLREKIINGEVLKRLLVEIIEEEENEK